MGSMSALRQTAAPPPPPRRTPSARQAAKATARQFGALVQRGVKHLMAKEHHAAIPALTEAVRIGVRDETGRTVPDAWDARLLLSACYVGGADDLERSGADSSKPIDAQLTADYRGTIREYLGLARVLLERCHAEKPRHYEAASWLASNYAKSGMNAEALPLYTQLLKAAFPAGGGGGKGASMEQQIARGDFESPRQELSSGQKATLLSEAVRAHVRLEQWAEAKAAFDRVKAAEPRLPYSSYTQLPANGFVPELRARPYWPAEELPFLTPLQAAAKPMASELRAALGGAGGAKLWAGSDFYLANSAGAAGEQAAKGESGWAEQLLYIQGSRLV